jgi:uncharacterized protein (DUF2147 family)
MKTKVFLSMLTILFLSPVLKLSAQDFSADDILGVWLNEDKDAHVEIYKEGNKYFGKIIWLKNPIDDETGKHPKNGKTYRKNLNYLVFSIILIIFYTIKYFLIYFNINYSITIIFIIYFINMVL